MIGAIMRLEAGRPAMDLALRQRAGIHEPAHHRLV
jgi:hypothetical protein